MMVLASWPFWSQTIIKVVVVMGVIPVGALVFGYVFLFKMMSHMQSRLGPMEAGPHGTLQLIADAGKFLQKEDIIPNRADRHVFMMAPIVVLISTFLLYAVIPAGPYWVVANIDTGIFFALAVSSLSVIGVLMAGWSSANKYSLIGALRAGGQLIAYELPLVLAVVGVVIQAGSMSMQAIVHSQATFKVFGHNFHGLPFAITQFIGFIIFIMAAQAELSQAPFDMPVAESELVAGYMTEYTGFRFLFFFMGEFGTAFALSALAATLFLGGWYFPGLGGHHLIFGIAAGSILGPVVLFAKIMFVAFLIFWMRFSFPRLREDQLQTLAWKYLIPLALFNIVLTATLKVVF